MSGCQQRKAGSWVETDREVSRWSLRCEARFRRVLWEGRGDSIYCGRGGEGRRQARRCRERLLYSYSYSDSSSTCCVLSMWVLVYTCLIITGYV